MLQVMTLRARRLVYFITSTNSKEKNSVSVLCIFFLFLSFFFIIENFENRKKTYPARSNAAQGCLWSQGYWPGVKVSPDACTSSDLSATDAPIAPKAKKPKFASLIIFQFFFRQKKKNSPESEKGEPT
jgi:hypothetical protein